MQGTPKDQKDKAAPAKPPALSPAKQAEKARLAEALRENLRRRKAQSRQRQAETLGDSGSDPA
jgi:hypothetical protein